MANPRLPDDVRDDVSETQPQAASPGSATPFSWWCQHLTITTASAAGIKVTSARCAMCTPPRRVVLRVEYFVETDDWNAERLTDAITDGIVEAAEKHRAQANGGVRPLSLFELEHHDGMRDPEYRQGVAEAEAELRLARLYPFSWWRNVLRKTWASIVSAAAINDEREARVTQRTETP